jgi:hypothetical protein
MCSLTQFLADRLKGDLNNNNNNNNNNNKGKAVTKAGCGSPSDCEPSRLSHIPYNYFIDFDEVFSHTRWLPALNSQ